MKAKVTLRIVIALFVLYALPTVFVWVGQNGRVNFHYVDDFWGLYRWVMKDPFPGPPPVVHPNIEPVTGAGRPTPNPRTLPL